MFGEKKTVVQNIQGLFVKPPDPKELVRKWQSDIRYAAGFVIVQSNIMPPSTHHHQHKAHTCLDDCARALLFPSAVQFLLAYRTCRILDHNPAQALRGIHISHTLAFSAHLYTTV